MPTVSELVSKNIGNATTNAQTWSGILFNVKSYGALGDGVTDDTAAIQAAIDAASPGGIVFFPMPTVCYNISSRLNIGAFSVNATNDVAGFANAKIGITLEGNFGSTPSSSDRCIKWVGTAQPGTTKVTKTCTAGTYPLITDAEPMFRVVSGRRIHFKNMKLDGNSKAYAGIHFEGNHYDVTFEGIQVVGCKFGVRNGTFWDHALAVAYYGYAADPGFAAGASAISNGGWQADTHTHINCDYDGTIADFGVESAQAVNQKMIGVNFYGTNTAGIIMVGGRVNLDNVNFQGTGGTVADIWQITGTNHLSCQNVHTESSAPQFLRTTTVASAPVISLRDCNILAKDIDIKSGGCFMDIENSVIDGVIYRRDVNARFVLTVKGGSVDSINLVSTVKNKIHVDIDTVECTGGGNLFQGAASTDFIGTAKNIYPITAIDSCLEYSRNGETYRTFRQDTLKKNRHSYDFEGYEQSIADETATDLFSFIKGVAKSASVEVDFSWGSGSSTSMCTQTDKIKFVYVTDSAGNTTVSTATVISSTQALDSVASLSITYTPSYDAGTGRVKLTVNQNNENGDVALSCAWYGKFIMGGASFADTYDDVAVYTAL